MKNLSFYHWFTALFGAVFFHALLAVSWPTDETSKIERSAGAPVTIVGSLSAFAEQKAVEEIVEEVTEPVEDVSEIEPLEPVTDPVPQVVEKQLVSKEIEPDEQSELPVIKPTKKIKKAKPKKKKKKVKKTKKDKKKQKKRRAGKRLAALKKGGGARGKQKRIAGKAAMSNYRGRVQSHLARYKRKVGSSRGRVVVSFSLSRSGGVRGVRVVRSSGNGSIDRAAISMVKRASPFPRMPAGGPASMRFSVPISYR
ncbi:hypothetical protein NBRC116602_17690 [Hyphomicrobiales bacterium 4NK60-0047b]|jgi:protein TonB